MQRVFFDTLLFLHRGGANPPPLEHGLGSAAHFGRMEYGGREGFGHPGPGPKKHRGLLLSLSLGSFCLWRSQEPRLEDPPATPWRSPHGEEPRPPTNSHVSGSWKWVLLPPVSHPMPVTLVNILTVFHERPGARIPQLNCSRSPILRNHVR